MVLVWQCASIRYQHNICLILDVLVIQKYVKNLLRLGGSYITNLLLSSSCCLVNLGKIIHQEKQNFINNTQILVLSGIWHLNDSTINRLFFSADTILLGIFVISCVRGIFENFWQTDKFSIRTVFKTKCTLCGLLTTDILERVCLIFLVKVVCAILLKQADC